MTDLHARLRRHGLFNAKVPRFTSYPPANRFSEDVSDATVEPWLSSVPPGAAISLYVHIPFCRRLCWFCACRTQGTKTDVPLARYVDALLEEIAIVRARLPRELRVSRLHLGGGTPTILPPWLMDRLLGALDNAFGISGRDEFSVEIDPVEIDRDRLDLLVRYGLNRASLGVQDFDPRVQEAIGRMQSVDETRAAVDMLRDLGVQDLNFDLLYGLPYQTMDSLDRTLDSVLDIAPGRLALYGYAHVPWMSKRQMVIPHEALPGPEDRHDLFDHARKRLAGQGYVQVGIDHFARPDDGLARAMVERRLSRNFQGYTDDRIPWLIGLGASAISRFPQGYAQNQAATALYQMAIAQGRPATYRGIRLTAEDRARAEVIQHLMCYHAVRLSDLDAPVPDVARWLDGLVAAYPDAMRFDGRLLTIEPWARPLVRIFAARLGDTRPTTEQSFSAAI
ncbi:Oxygen-independent coproporphyrinogen-III oxidase [Marinibacterium anthonyi]|nr:Oxygen-independent coproporphyrinogen-III oxidase [Marinibacterium anthonyi]